MKKAKQKVNFMILLTFWCLNICAQSTDALDAKGLRHGLWKGVYEDSKNLRYEGNFNHGKEEGLFTYYANSDKKTVMATRNFDKKNNAYTIFFDEKKNKVSEGNVINKLREGTWKYYHKGVKTIMTTENYAKDKLQGARKVFYPSGKIAEDVAYKENLKNGVSKTYSKEGKLIEEANYVNGVLQGSYTIYDDLGNLTIKGQFKNDVKKGIWKYYEKGKFIKEENKDIIKVSAKKEEKKEIKTEEKKAD